MMLYHRTLHPCHLPQVCFELLLLLLLLLLLPQRNFLPRPGLGSRPRRLRGLRWAAVLRCIGRGRREDG